MASIQGIYVALFGRPADPSGLAYFDGITNHGADLSAIANLAGQPEYLSRFTGLTNMQILNSIYQSLFGRDGEQAGVDFWVGKLASGALNINTIAIAILDGAKGSDKATAEAKIAAADLFTKSLTTAEIAAYNGIAATAEIKAYLAKVTADHPGSLADIAGMALHLLPTDTTSAPTGPSFGRFTTGNDTIDDHAMTGAHTYSATFTGGAATLNSGDSLIGNGQATLAVSDNLTGGASTVLPGTLSGFETLSLTSAENVGTSGSAFELQNFSGLTSVTLDTSGTAGDYIKASSTIGISAHTVGSGFTLLGGASGLDLTDSALTSLGVAGTIGGGVTLHNVAATTLSISLDAFAGGITDADNHITTLSISNSASPSTIDAINDTALTSITLSGSVTLGTDANHLFTLANGITTVSGAADNADNFISVSAANATATLGNGNNTVSLAATATGAHLSLGNGNNTVTDNADGATITVGSGSNVIDLVSHTGSVLRLGPNGNFSSDPLTPNVVIENAVAGTSIQFAAFANLAIYNLENLSASSAADLIQGLERHVNGSPQSADAQQYGGNTYIVASATGSLGPADTVIVEVIGVHGINIASGNIVLTS